MRLRLRSVSSYEGTFAESTIFESQQKVLKRNLLQLLLYKPQQSSLQQLLASISLTNIKQLMKIFRVKYCFSSVRVRFLHKLEYKPTIFHLRTYLYSYLFSKSQKGTCITLYDETNLNHPQRNADTLNNYLKWLKIFPQSKQEQPIMMNEHKSTYVKHLKELINNGSVYLCFCGKNLKTYDGQCRSLTTQLIQKMLEAKLPYKVRLKQPDTSLKYKDLVYGDQEEYPREDPVIEDPSLGLSTQFKAVISDKILNVTHLFHSSETLPELNEYLTISSILYKENPTIISLPKLQSTPLKSLTLQNLKSLDYQPAAIVNFVALLGWRPFGDSAANLLNQARDYIFELQDLINYFDVDKISKKPIAYQLNKLKILNKMYVKKDITKKVDKKNQSGIEDFRVRLNNLIGDDVMDTFSDEYLRKSLQLISKNIKKWSQLNQYTFLFVPTFNRSKPNINKELQIKINNNIILILKHLIPPDKFTRATLGERLSEFLQDFRKEITPEEFYKYFKYCICGQPNTKLSALDIADILGHQEILSRVEQCQPLREDKDKI